MNRRGFLQVLLAVATTPLLCSGESARGGSVRLRDVVVTFRGFELEPTLEQIMNTPPEWSLPERCAVHQRERTEEEWDPVREEYWPPNHEWEQCMGVGR